MKFVRTKAAHFFYNGNSKEKTIDELIMTQQFGSSFEERDAIRQEQLRMLHGQPEAFSGPDWHVLQGKDNYGLLRLIRSGEVCVGAWVNSEKLMVPLNLIDLGQSGAALLTTDELKPVDYEELEQVIDKALVKINKDLELSAFESNYKHYVQL